MLKITDFADKGGVDRLVYFVEEIWGTLHPDCGPNDLEAIEEETAVVIAERDRLRRELEEAKAELKDIREQVTEWVCDKCNWCYPGPPQNGAACVQCPRCLGLCGPRFVVQYHRAQRELDETKAELARMKITRDAPRPCPWCHVIPQVRPDWTDCRRFRVDCANDDCPVKPGCKGDSEEEAVAIWNGGV